MSKQPKAAARRPATGPLRRMLWPCALILLVVLAYANSLGVPLIYDNDPIILRDTRLRQWTGENIGRILSEQYWETGVTSGLYRPLTTLSYLFNYAVLGNGPDPTGYHWVNLALHAGNVVLVYWLGAALFGAAAPAFCLAALWGVHPVLTESVTNVVGRADLLSAMGVLGALLCFGRVLRGERMRLWLVLFALAVAVGMCSKESTIVVLALLPLYTFCFERDKPLRTQAPAYAVAGLICAAFLLVRARVLAGHPSFHPFLDNPLTGADFWTGRITAFTPIFRYFGLMLWPASLSADYSYNEIPLFTWKFANWGDLQALLGLLLCLGGGAVALWTWRRHPAVTFLLGLFFFALAPVSNLFVHIGSIMAERFLYLPAIGFLGALVYAASRWLRMASRNAVVVVAVLVFALTVRTWARNADWQDARRFWESNVASAPASYHTNILAAWSVPPRTAEEWSRSIEWTDRAMQILDPVPDDRNGPFAYADAGAFYRTLGDRVAAGQTAGPRASGTTPDLWYNRALAALLRGERIDNASIGRSPSTAFGTTKVYLELGRTYVRLKQPALALSAYERGRGWESSAEILDEMAPLYEAAGDDRNAALALIQAIAVDPANGGRRAGKLMELYGRIEPAGCATVRENGRPSLNFECPLVRRDICAASRNLGRTYLRRNQQRESGKVRDIAIRELGCPAESLN